MGTEYTPTYKTWEVIYTNGRVEHVTAVTLWTPNFLDTDVYGRASGLSHEDLSNGRVHFKWYDNGLVLSVAENQLQSVRVINDNAQKPTPESRFATVTELSEVVGLAQRAGIIQSDEVPIGSAVFETGDDGIDKDALLATPIESLLDSGATVLDVIESGVHTARSVYVPVVKL